MGDQEGGHYSIEPKVWEWFEPRRCESECEGEEGSEQSISLWLRKGERRQRRWLRVFELGPWMHGRTLNKIIDVRGEAGFEEKIMLIVWNSPTETSSRHLHQCPWTWESSGLKGQSQTLPLYSKVIEMDVTPPRVSRPKWQRTHILGLEVWLVLARLGSNAWNSEIWKCCCTPIRVCVWVMIYPFVLIVFWKETFLYGCY